MRVILLMVAFGFLVLYASIGVRFGVLPDFPITYWNAEGLNEYKIPVQIALTSASLAIKLKAKIDNGRTTIEVISPSGLSIYKRQLQPGREVQEVQNLIRLENGNYRMQVRFERSSGKLALSWKVLGNF